MLLGDEVVEYPVLEELEMTDKDMVGREAVTEVVKSFEKAQQRELLSLRRG